MTLNGLGIAKFAATFVVGAGTRQIITGIIKNNVTPENAFDKIKIVAATTVLGAVVARQAKKYTDETIDDIANFVRTTVQSMRDGENLLDQMFGDTVDAEVVKEETPAETVKNKKAANETEEKASASS